MSVLVDTNVLLRLAQPNHRQYPAAIDGVVRARLAGETLYVTPQNNAEFWAAATRPVGAANGLGLTATAAAGEIATIERLFQLAADDPAIHPIWKGLVITHRVLGTQGYDARLVAAMLAHGIDRILTFNVADFSRYGVNRAASRSGAVSTVPADWDYGAKSSGCSTIGAPCAVRAAA